MSAASQHALPLTVTGAPPLRCAYEQTRLAEMGITYEKALAIPLVRMALEYHAKAITEPRKA